MGGLGSHHAHSYAVQTAALLVSMLVPGGVLALLVGAWVEQARRRFRTPAAHGMTSLVGAERALAD
ncbi:MAG: hypothetical protein KGN02_04105 [bacterium]|nr:hypothetical protein [bacterium]